MLSRSHRISKKLLEDVVKRGKVVHSPLFFARILDDGSEKVAKFAPVVPVKIGKTSVSRHRIRRKMYEAIRPMMSNLKNGINIIIFAKAPIMTATTVEINAGIKEFFVKSGLLR